MMKKVFLLVVLVFNLITISAQEPQLILGIAKEEKSIEYYDQQFDLWTKETQKNPSNDLAWRQRYLAKRAFLQKTSPQMWMNEQDRVFNQLNTTIEESHKHIGNSFEYFFMKAMNSTGAKAIENSMKAHEIDPDRSEVYGWLFGFAVIDGNEELAADMAKRMMESNIYSNANLLWNLNGLSTAEPNSVFIANGDLDGGPKWLLQYAEGIRKDVLVVSKWSMEDDAKYRRRVFQKVGIAEPLRDKTQFKSPADYVDYLTVALLTNGKKKAYMQCGTDVQFFKKYNLEDKMYLVGNAFVYSEQRFDNYKLLRKNLREYKLEYLTADFQHHPEQSMIKENIQLTYLPALHSAIKYYKKVGNSQEVFYYKGIFDAILNQSGRENELREWYK